MANEDINAEVGKRLGGAHAMGAAKVGVTADTSQVKTITGAFSTLSTSVKKLREQFQGLVTDATKANAAMSGAAGAGVTTKAGGTASGHSSLPTSSQTGSPANPASPAKAKGGFLSRAFAADKDTGDDGGAGAGGGARKAGGYMSAMLSNLSSKGGGGGGGGGAPTTTWGKIGNFTVDALATGVKTIDRRVDENRAYALPASRITMQTQMLTGQSENQVMNQTRKPLMDYKLGVGGANALQANQNRFGIKATPEQAAGMASLRATSGFSLETSDLVGMQNSLMAPSTVNKMFSMTGGLSFAKVGGGAADVNKTMYDLNGRLGLNTNRKLAESAQQQGSFTRSNLSAMGVDSATQDLMLQKAVQQNTFREKGGKGMFDPNKKADQKLVGIKDSFAMQSEETKRVQGARDESMYRDQSKSYAKMEETNQKLISALGSLEHSMKALISARTETRGFQKMLGSALKWGGAAVMAGTGFTGVGAAAGALMMGAGTVVGDPIDKGKKGATPATGVVTLQGSSSAANDDKIMVPTGGKAQSLSAVKQMGSFRGMKPIMQDRLLRAMRENPKLGFGQGSRSQEEQKRMFLDRYRKTDKATGIVYDGSNWEKVKGADAAPPGASMHEIGLAADLVGDLDWLQANASRFGLKTFGMVNKEPWHVQPVEFANSRKKYEAMNGGALEGVSFSDTPDTESSPSYSSAGDMESAPNSFGNASIFDRALAIPSSLTPKTTSASSALGPPTLTNDLPFTSGGTFTPSQIAQVAYNAGFRGHDLVLAVDAALSESSGHIGAQNMNLGTQDNSYGLWQINMLPNANGPALEKLGFTRDSLLDPNINGRAAFELYKRNGNTMRPWFGYKEGIGEDSPKHQKYMPAAVEATAPFMQGDPLPMDMGKTPRGRTPRPSIGGGTMTFNSSPTITIPMNFTFNGVPGDIDIKKIANQVRTAISSQLDIETMRSR